MKENQEKISLNAYMDNKYGKNNYDKGPSSEYNKLKKWGDRGFE